jgi:hypothetical protein
VALSRPKQGFEFPMGHMLPHAFTAWGSLLFTPQQVTSRLAKILYQSTPLSDLPLNKKTRHEIGRNAEIKKHYTEGKSIRDLAKEYGISMQRVHQILNNKRK